MARPLPPTPTHKRTTMNSKNTSGCLTAPHEHARPLRGTRLRAALREAGFGLSRPGSDAFQRVREQRARRASRSAARRPATRARRPRPTAKATRTAAPVASPAPSTSSSSSTGDSPPPSVESPAGPAPARAVFVPASVDAEGTRDFSARPFNREPRALGHRIGSSAGGRRGFHRPLARSSAHPFHHVDGDAPDLVAVLVAQEVLS